MLERILLVLLSVIGSTLQRSLYSTNYFLRDYGYPEENLGIDRRFYKEGDIRLTLPRKPDVMQRKRRWWFQAQHKEVFGRRNAVRDIYATWLNRTVPYIISAAYDKDQRNEMLGAMNEFEANTCIRFRPRRREPDYINIKPEGSCSSAVGRQGGEQTVSIGAGCNRKGTIMHELMHALGFWHEHSRPDRGRYITIMWDNIPEEHESNFKSYSTEEIDTLGAPYDYGSITHYKNNTFAKDRNKPTITAKHPLPPGVEMGQRLKLSDIDILKINRLYRCNITHCPDAGAPKGGYRKGDDFSVSKTVSYYCHSGYTLVGSHQRYCMDIGQWTGNLPMCFLANKSGKLKYCNFDRGGICDGWKQDTTDDTQWKLTNRHTPSENTGPKDDHTMGTQEGYYIFLESSTPCKEGMKARLISPTFSFSDTQACLLFYYNMFGKTMGTLNVYQRIGGKNVLKYTRSGNYGPDWEPAVIALEQYSQFEIIFEAVAGSSFTSDVALDDIVVGSCDSLVPHFKNLLSINMSCDFNSGLCGFIQANDDVFDWQLKSGPTSTILTGPECDQSNCSHGKYLYTEASSPRVQGDTARIVSPMLMGGSAMCLSFLFHMYGITMGTLNVYIKEYNAARKLVWTRSGDHGNKWQKEYIDFNPRTMYKIIFEGLRGSSYRSDVAIDNFDVQPGTCADVLYFNCDFEQDLCGWKNVPIPSDSFDWTRKQGPTWTGGTGPSTDHTKQTVSGYYMYIETSLQPSGTFARLVSPKITDEPTGYCIQFWYHMYGLDVKALKIIRQSVEKRGEKQLWQTTGQHGNWWRRQRLFVGSSGQDFRILIEATAGGHRGDIAIDDVSIQTGSCYSYDAKTMHNFPFVQLHGR
ncbi:MAM and LDL-receptor class A domain-containing protein 1-like isoform X2 [Gigantopelta aegis]|uniref:MAM and LDL-receptor class A domain-containing protein 1-like isoform X2 n=1 Tax=Gigantopelta aegis TaxID=1735272 RepID=UPI001B88AF3F|nr:MAM and LDL-receptor class A domain-containing protein 1-like isoform X2 [Gigantopelta aegis]